MATFSGQNTKIQRRSGRVTEETLKKQRNEYLEQQAQKENEYGLSETISPTKERGVVTTKRFLKDDYVATYRGDLLKGRTSIKKKKTEHNEKNSGSYMYDFKFRGKPYCIDATEESPYLARLINHSTKNPNLRPRVLSVNGTPILFFLALRDIEMGEELLYDYNDKDRETVEANPWLKNS